MIVSLISEQNLQTVKAMKVVKGIIDNIFLNRLNDDAIIVA